MKKSLAILSVLLIAAFLLAACGGATATTAPVVTEKPAVTTAPEETTAPVEKVTIRFAYNWTGGDSKAQYYEAALNKYKEDHKDTVDLILENTPSTDHENKIKVDLAGGNLPDVVLWWTGSARLEALDYSNALLDMDKFFAVSKKTAKNQWSESAYNGSIMEGKIYTLPIESFKGFFVYNKSLFDKYGLKVPTNYTELKEVSTVFLENGIIPIHMGSKGGQPSHLFFSAIQYQLPNGFEEAVGLAKSFDVSTESWVKTSKIVEEMVALDMFPEDTVANGDWGPAVALYNAEKAAMVYCFPWKIGDISPEIVAVSEVTSFPMMDGAVTDPKTFAIGGVSMGITINRKSFEDMAKQAAIVDFVDFLVSDEMFGELGKASMMPAKSGVKLDPAVLNPLFVKAVAFTDTQAATLDPTYVFIPWQSAVTVYWDVLDQLWAGQPAAQFITKLQEAVTAEKK